MRFFKKKNVCSNEQGSTVVEFALLIPVFIVFAYAIFDLGSYFFVNAQLQTATEQAARHIRVGGSYDADGTGPNSPIVLTASNSQSQAAFKQLTCSYVYAIFKSTCLQKLLVDVQSFPASNFSDVTYSNISDGANASHPADGTLNDDDTTYNPGGGGYVVIVRALYPYNFLLPQLAVLTGMPTGSHRSVSVISTVAFRNEPF